MRRALFIEDTISVDTDGSFPVACSGFERFQHNKSISILSEISALFDHMNVVKCFQNWCTAQLYSQQTSLVVVRPNTTIIYLCSSLPRRHFR